MKPLYGGHHRDLKIASATERCPLHGGSSQTGLFCFKNLLLLGFGVYGNQPQSVSRDQFWEKEERIGNILEDMFTTWQPLAGECLKYLEEPTNEVDKYTVAVNLTNSHCKEEFSGHVQQNNFTITSMFLSLLHCALDIFATGKCHCTKNEVFH